MVFFVTGSFAQQFTHADTLRGSNGPARKWWDATKYDLHVTFNIKDSTIRGYNTISFKAVEKGGPMQIDLKEPMVIDSIKSGSASAKTQLVSDGFTRDGSAYFVRIPDAENMVLFQNSYFVTIYYHGKPAVAVKPPWEGGLVWARDRQNQPWISIACQHLGASVWYPCKDYQGDEPDSAEMHITAPSDLVAVSNGRQRNLLVNNDGTTTTTWAVVNPINNYDFIPYIGKYTHFGEVYPGEKGDLTLDYWVLDSNLARAKKQFKEVPRMMQAFEYWFGPYPFYKDGYKLVDAPYLGMEHQSAVAYGNGYQNGYRGRDLSGTGVGLQWDFIIVHESGHEWFGNNITADDIADDWIHEGFTSYSETLFTEYWFGKKAAETYVTGLRKNIENQKPVIAPYGVNANGPIDIYYKASNMLHTIRQVINNDSLFRKILRGLNQTFYHKTVTSRQIEDYISQTSGIDFSRVFDQYLRTTKIPTLEYSLQNGILSYRWINVIPGFQMPVRIYDEKGALQFIYPSEKIKKLPTRISSVKLDENFYVYSNQIK